MATSWTDRTEPSTSWTDRTPPTTGWSQGRSQLWGADYYPWKSYNFPWLIAWIITTWTKRTSP